MCAAPVDATSATERIAGAFRANRRCGPRSCRHTRGHQATPSLGSRDNDDQVDEGVPQFDTCGFSVNGAKCNEV